MRIAALVRDSRPLRGRGRGRGSWSVPLPLFRLLKLAEVRYLTVPYVSTVAMWLGRRTKGYIAR